MDIKKLFRSKYELVSAYHALFDAKDPQSRLVVYDLMKFTNMLGPTYSSGDSAESMAFEEGKRAVMLYILHQTQINPAELYDRLMDAGREEEVNE